jgi:hypothetical protein
MPASTPIYGFPYPLGTDPVSSGAQDIQNLATAVEGAIGSVVGLMKITPSSVTGTGATIAGNGDVVVAAGGNSVTIENCFSASHQNYEVVFSNWRGTAVSVLNMQLRNVVGTSNTQYYVSYAFGAGNYSGTVNMTAVGVANQSVLATDALCGTTTESGLRCTFYQPQLAKTTSYTGLTVDARTGGNGRHGFSGFHNVATAYTSLVVSCGTGNFTTLTVSIYGYN